VGNLIVYVSATKPGKDALIEGKNTICVVKVVVELIDVLVIEAPEHCAECDARRDLC
jgi:hypothetical protein